MEENPKPQTSAAQSGLAQKKEGDRKSIIIAVAGLAIIIALALAGYIWFAAVSKRSENQVQTDEKIIEGAAKGALPSLSNNPLDNKPNINPAEKINPVKAIKINPFE